jgi:hypothetical protein
MGREDDLLHANAHSRTTAKRRQVFLEALPISRVHPTFRREGMWIRKDLGVLVDELLSQAHGRLRQVQMLTLSGRYYCCWQGMPEGRNTYASRNSPRFIGHGATRVDSRVTTRSTGGNTGAERVSTTTLQLNGNTIEETHRRPSETTAF